MGGGKSCGVVIAVEEFKKECIGLENFITDKKIEQTEIDIENILVVLFFIFALIDCLKLQFNTLVLVKIH